GRRRPGHGWCPPLAPGACGGTRPRRRAHRGMVRRRRGQRSRPARRGASPDAGACAAHGRVARRGERTDAVTRSPAGHRRMAQAIGVCGGTIALAMVALAFVDARNHPFIFVAWALLAGAAYLIALALLGGLRPGDTRALALCLVLGAAWRIPLVAAPPRLSTDVYRYVWDGRLQRLGEDP